MPLALTNSAVEASRYSSVPGLGSLLYIQVTNYMIFAYRLYGFSGSLDSVMYSPYHFVVFLSSFQFLMCMSCLSTQQLLVAQSSGCVPTVNCFSREAVWAEGTETLLSTCGCVATVNYFQLGSCMVP